MDGRGIQAEAVRRRVSYSRQVTLMPAQGRGSAAGEKEVVRVRLQAVVGLTALPDGLNTEREEKKKGLKMTLRSAA